MGTIEVPDGEFLGSTLGYAGRSKPGVDEGSGVVLSGGSIEFTWVDNLEGAGPGGGEPLSNSEGTRVDNKLRIYDVGVLVITHGASDRSKLRGEKVSGQVLSDGSFEGAMYDNPEFGYEDPYDSAIIY